MSGGLPFNNGVVIPTYVATSFAGAAPLVELQFAFGPPPIDGSVGLCFIVLDPSSGLIYASGAKQRLAYFTNNGLATGPGKADVTAGGGVTGCNVQDWSFVADAS